MWFGCSAKETASAFALEMHLRVRWAMGWLLGDAPNLGPTGATLLVGGAGTRGDVSTTY